MSSNTSPSYFNEAYYVQSAAAKVPKRTPMACQFCRGRKLKCDGRTTCGNCSKRGGVCLYTPVKLDPNQQHQMSN
ncbi:hypothetical protein DL96DRAFT_1618207 [Flagelloscypha sp. PMI_526]|nr:hypothetical protein DL96DRAFT_1618207 [Flagelloscypha sp. PMI_526]